MFVYGVRFKLKFFFSLSLSSCTHGYPALFVGKVILSPLNCLTVKSWLSIDVWSVSGLPSAALVCLLASPPLFQLLTLYNTSWKRPRQPCTSDLLHSVLAILRSLHFHRNSRLSLSISIRQPAGVWIAIVLCLHINLRRIYIFQTESSGSWPSISLRWPGLLEFLWAVCVVFSVQILHMFC